jgi:hypothetical protein
MWFAEGAPNHIQRLPRLPTAPQLGPLRRRSATRFPWVIHTTFEQRIYIRRCCIDPLRPPRLPDKLSTSPEHIQLSDLSGVSKNARQDSGVSNLSAFSFGPEFPARCLFSGRAQVPLVPSHVFQGFRPTSWRWLKRKTGRPLALWPPRFRKLEFS